MRVIIGATSNASANKRTLNSNRPRQCESNRIRGSVKEKTFSMCGICRAVWIDADGTLADGPLRVVMDQVVDRGPDDAGVYRDGYAALGFRRLSVIDVAGGHQPLSSENGTIWTVYNGEIYNYLSLRRRLKRRDMYFAISLTPGCLCISIG